MVGLVTRYSIYKRELSLIEKALEAGRAAGKSHDPVRPAPTVHRATQRLSQEERTDLVRRYASGVPALQLAEDYGLNRQTVVRLVRRAGGALQRPRLTEKETVSAIRLYQEGLSLAKVGVQLGRDAGSIRNVLLRAEVVLRDSHGREA